MDEPQKKTLHLVLVDNDDNDVFFIERAMRKAGLLEKCTRLIDGQQAIEYFSRLPQEDAPDLLLLDVQMPRKNGFEVLQWLRQSSHKELPVIMLTSSDDPADMRKARTLGAYEFLTKKTHCHHVIDALNRFAAREDAGRVAERDGRATV
jgi:CheY-like chemotaxis protein